jgi:hypothetical protein
LKQHTRTRLACTIAKPTWFLFTKRFRSTVKIEAGPARDRPITGAEPDHVTRAHKSRHAPKIGAKSVDDGIFLIPNAFTRIIMTALCKLDQIEWVNVQMLIWYQDLVNKFILDAIENFCEPCGDRLGGKIFWASYEDCFVVQL